VAPYVSAHVIKAAYRKLVKRWHPDLYPAGTSAHAEATQMTMLINQAYGVISHAPLRYNTGGYGSNPYNWRTDRSATPVTPTIRIDPVKPPRVDRLEFWIRFVCGAAFGMFSSATLLLSETSSNFSAYWALWAGVLALSVGFGLAAARYGDRFWYSVLSDWDPFF
jgi:curved DNA-binding protein CbpA